MALDINHQLAAVQPNRPRAASNPGAYRGRPEGEDDLLVPLCWFRTVTVDSRQDVLRAFQTAPEDGTILARGLAAIFRPQLLHPNPEEGFEDQLRLVLPPTKLALPRCSASRAAGAPGSGENGHAATWRRSTTVCTRERASGTLTTDRTRRQVPNVGALSEKDIVPRASRMMSGLLAQLPENGVVAVIRLRSLGDTVLTTPALALLKRARPDLRIALVVERPFDALLRGNLDIWRVLPITGKAGGRGLFGAIRKIRKLQPALCLNLHGGATSAWLTAFSGARFRAGFGHFRFRFAYNVRIPRAQQVLGRGLDDPVHTAEHHASAVFCLGGPESEIPRAVLRAEPSPQEHPYAVVHVTASYFTKQWPRERFRQIGAFLRRVHGLEPVIIAGPGEGSVLAELSDFTCLDGLSIDDLKSLLAGAELFVGNDSGPAHVAAAFDVPCVVIFGSSDSAVWGPWKTRHAVVETPWDCKPCPGDRCYAFDEPRCILSVEVASVEAAIDELLAGRSSAGSRPSVALR